MTEGTKQLNKLDKIVQNAQYYQQLSAWGISHVDSPAEYVGRATQRLPHITRLCLLTIDYGCNDENSHRGMSANTHQSTSTLPLSDISVL